MCSGGIAQVEKAKRSEQTVATCVLEVRTPSGGPGSSQLLLVQRPKDGLLGGMQDLITNGPPSSRPPMPGRISSAVLSQHC